MNFTDCPEMNQNPQPGYCGRCGAALSGRRTKWCSDECSDWFWRNHRFTNARFEALATASVYRLATADATWCRYCPSGPHGHLAGHVCALCEALKGAEVDQVERARGRHGELSCIHHQENLRVLCRDCHKAVTAQQRREDSGRKP